ncbi:MULTISPECIES: VPLPA-CTERM sorting domain-containing protein [Methylomonas]|uniref:VPLPA-CTERM sorting domain-containing protein n=1 Tax=Methylomonas TaxID=416 RepID=UPI001232A051|nr:VPLPA-CTERM sorting domain-containing protein [Methylomonas rhizoryzae]
MNVIVSIKTWLAICLFAVSTASSAGINWESTDGTSNFISFSSASFPFPSSDLFGIFSIDADLSSDAPLSTFTGLGSITETDPFQIGLWTSDGWISEAGATLLPAANTYLLVFATSYPLGNNLHFLYGFDIMPSVDQGGGPVVPLPASVWLMTSALLGLLYADRRKKVVAA